MTLVLVPGRQGTTPPVWIFERAVGCSFEKSRGGCGNQSKARSQGGRAQLKRLITVKLMDVEKERWKRGEENNTRARKKRDEILPHRVTVEGRKENTDPTLCRQCKKWKAASMVYFAAHFRHLPRNTKKKHQYARLVLPTHLTPHSSSSRITPPGKHYKGPESAPFSLFFFFFKHHFPPLNHQPTPSFPSLLSSKRLQLSRHHFLLSRPSNFFHHG